MRVCYFLLSAFAAYDEVALTTVANSKNEGLGHAIHTRGHGSLRVHAESMLGEDSGNDDDRMIDIKSAAVSTFQNLAKSGTQAVNKATTSVQLKLSSKSQKTTDNRFVSLDVGAVKSKLFESLKYQKWAESVTNAYKKNVEAGKLAMFSTLSAHYGDVALAKLLAEAQHVPKTRSVANLFEAIQLEKWLTEKKSTSQVFKLLHLDVDKGNLLKNPLVNTWVSYVDKIGKEDPYQILVRELTKRYGDDGLANVLVAAKADDTAQVIASKVVNAQLKSWLSSGVTIDDAFKLLQLNTVKKDDILKSPMLSAWMAYARMNKQDPNELLFSTLKSRFSDEEIIKMIVAARGDPKLWPSLGGLARMQLTSWQRADKSADDMFQLLKLRDGDEKPFDNPVFNTWVSYVTNLHQERTDEVIFSVMKKHYGEERLEKILGQATQSANTNSIALNLEKELWKSQGKTADDVFKALKLDKKGDNLFEDPAIRTWVYFVNKLNGDKKTPDEFAAISALEKHFDYVNLALLLGTAELQAKVKGETVEFVKTLTSLRNMQFKQWMVRKGFDPQRLQMALANRPFDKWNARISLDFSDFYKANGGLLIG
ncbi:hypothetical protein GN244_ATG02134 [Phytophthora infestans]|nr:hypothetical protein GN244_ATG02134 [Phytophthora infestans]KAF4129725.1 hypothetical protein GN958_ATG21220 [Phytophthora infestans]